MPLWAAIACLWARGYSGRRLEMLAQPVEQPVASLSCAVLGAALRRFAPGWQPPERQPEHYTLLLCVTGGATLLVAGQTTPLPPGGMLLVPPGATLARRGDVGAVGVGANAAFTVYAVDFTARLDGQTDAPVIGGVPLCLSPSNMCWLKLLEVARAIIDHLTKRPPGYKLAVHTQCVRMLELLWRETLTRRGDQRLEERPWRNLGTRAWRNADHWLRPVVEAIEARSAEHVTLAELAEIANLHPAYFSTLFKTVTGVSPLRFVTQHRLQRARDQLLLTDRPLGEIAAMTGFYDAAHLIRVFRRAEGTSPGRFRRSKEHPTTG